MKSGVFWLVCHAALASATPLVLCTIALPGIFLIPICILCMCVTFWALQSLREEQQIQFGSTTWVLGVLAYGSLAIDWSLGHFGYFAPLELVLSAATFLSGLLMLLFAVLRFLAMRKRGVRKPQ